jgi:hypothetical protein
MSASQPESPRQGGPPSSGARTHVQDEQMAGQQPHAISLQPTTALLDSASAWRHLWRSCQAPTVAAPRLFLRKGYRRVRCLVVKRGRSGGVSEVRTRRSFDGTLPSRGGFWRLTRDTSFDRPGLLRADRRAIGCGPIARKDRECQVSTEPILYGSLRTVTGCQE